MAGGLFAPTHILVVLIVALVVLGPKRLPDAARSLGHGFHEFRDSITGGDNEPEAPAAIASTPTPPARSES